MTAISMEGRHASVRSGFNVWRCCSCHCFHLKAGNVLLTFTPKEYERFTQAIVDCYQGKKVLCRHSSDGTGHESGDAMLTSEAEN
jgi:hypothetical protein